MIDIGVGEFYILFVGGKVLASLATVTVITSLVTLLTTTALASLLFCIAEFGGASHVAMAATLDPMASIKVLSNPKEKRRSKKVFPLLFWFIFFAGALFPVSKIGIQQLLLGLISTERVTVYPVRNEPQAIRGQLFGLEQSLPGIPLLVTDKYPLASANPVRSAFSNCSTSLVYQDQLTEFPSASNENRKWLQKTLYGSLPAGLFGLDGSLYAIEL
ncbi:UNVERIFIED_CONTAM: hypothetical protein HDU68_001170, partial [Siphonaria sp. JEL0065]